MGFTGLGLLGVGGCSCIGKGSSWRDILSIEPWGCLDKTFEDFVAMKAYDCSANVQGIQSLHSLSLYIYIYICPEIHRKQDRVLIDLWCIPSFPLSLSLARLGAAHLLHCSSSNLMVPCNMDPSARIVSFTSKRDSIVPLANATGNCAFPTSVGVQRFWRLFRCFPFFFITCKTFKTQTLGVLAFFIPGYVR